MDYMDPKKAVKLNHSLTHLTLDKMVAISQTIFFRCISMNEKFCILIKILLKFVLKGPVDNILPLV